MLHSKSPFVLIPLSLWLASACTGDDSGTTASENSDAATSADAEAGSETSDAGSESASDSTSDATASSTDTTDSTDSATATDTTDTSTSDTGTTDTGTTDTGTTDTGTTDTGMGGMNPDLPDLFDDSLFTVSPSTVNCTLDNGSNTQCWQISFDNYMDSSGPFCPATVNDIGGVGIYDGPTNPGFQVLKDTLWYAMEADGYDIIDAQGNINQQGMPGNGQGVCLNMPLQQLEITFLIPAEPEMLNTPNQIDTVELYGVSTINGMPLTGHPPSVVDGPPIPGASGGGIPSLDPCGGHPDPAGYWHWHFTSENAQSVLDAHGITEVSCTDIPQKTEGLVGFAKDGYPIYSPREDGTVPTGLDACNGKFGVTADYPEGVYHYYALDETAPNLPTCIMGASVNNPMSYN